MNKLANLQRYLITTFKIFFIILFCIPLIYAQEVLDTPTGISPGVPSRNASGTPINQDYFAAHRSFEWRKFLNLVERFHLKHENVLSEIRKGSFKRPIFDLEYTLERFPNHPIALQLIGSIARLTNTPELALYHYKKALSLYPQYALTRAQYGEYLIASGNIEAGIAELKEAIKMDPKLAQAYIWLAKAYYRKGDTELGRQAANQAKELGYKGDIVGETKRASNQ